MGNVTVCCSQKQDTAPSADGHVQVHACLDDTCSFDANSLPSSLTTASSKENLLEKPAKGKENKISKSKAKENLAKQAKLKDVTEARKKLQTLCTTAVETSYASLGPEFECQKNIWQIMLTQNGAVEQSSVNTKKICVEQLSAKIHEALTMGTKDPTCLQNALQDISCLAAEVDDSLNNSMRALLQTLMFAISSAPHRSTLLKTVQQVEFDLQNGLEPKKLAGFEIEAILKQCHLEQTLEIQLRAGLGRDKSIACAPRAAGAKTKSK